MGCLTTLGCFDTKAQAHVETGGPMTMATLQSWIERSVTERMRSAFTMMLKFKKVQLDMPRGVDFVWQPTSIQGKPGSKKLEVLTGTVSTKTFEIHGAIGVHEKMLGMVEKKLNVLAK